jgi:hypothetical protein
MNLSELEISKTLKRVGYAGDIPIQTLLDKHGWTLLGTGMEAMVAQKPGAPYVLKLFITKSAYVHFVAYCQQHADNPFLPRFSRYVRPVPGTTFSYVRMEKLKPLSEKQLLTQYPEYVCALNHMFRHPEGEFHSEHGIFWNHAMSTWDIDELPEKQGYTDVQDCMRHVNPQFVQTVKDLVHVMKTKSLKQLDLHSANMMQRGPGKLVITDPFV